METRDLDSDNVGTIGSIVLAQGDCTSAAGPVAVSVLINIVLRNGLAPGCMTLELDMVDIDAGIDNELSTPSPPPGSYL